TSLRATGSNTWTVFAAEQATKARAGEPEKTTSAGSSDVSKVAWTRWPAAVTMLTESEMELTTQSSSSVRNRTVTGSSSTLILPIGCSLAAETSNNSIRLSGRLHTARILPLGLRSTG